MSAELLICFLASELPLDGLLRGVASLLPRVNLALQTVLTEPPQVSWRLFGLSQAAIVVT